MLSFRPVLRFSGYNARENCLPFSIQQCRCKYKSSKKKLNEYKYLELRKRNSSTEIAKEYFDLQYPKYLSQNVWASVRCAMLSRKKYSCVINKFSKISSETEQFYLNQGALDVADEGHSSLKLYKKVIDGKIEKLQDNIEKEIDDEKALLDYDKVSKLQNHLDFVEDLTSSPLSFKAYIFPREDFTEFKDVYKYACSSDVLPYFLLDAASVLPVYLLNLKPDDSVLDLCSSPGGKLTTMLQCLGTEGSIVGNDISKQRFTRLKKVVKQYVPKDSRTKIKLVNLDGRLWDEVEVSSYDKVLVDVPCTNDRFAMYEHERDTDCIFSKLRKRERQKLPKVQAELLKSAILACKPGGSIVYSTCSISPLQNDFIVNYVIQELQEELDIKVTSQPLDYFVKSFSKHFNFFSKSMEGIPPHGVLVYPTLDCNFGPMYMSKLVRE